MRRVWPTLGRGRAGAPAGGPCNREDGSMRGTLRTWRSPPRVVGGLAAAVLLALACAAAGDEPRPDVLPPDAAVPAPPLTLTACRGIALARQPAVAAARASLAAAAARSEALENLRAPELIRPDLPYRRQQAALGVKIAEAGLAQAEADADHAVTYTYLAALFARQQQDVADRAIENLNRLEELIQPAVAGKTRKDVSEQTLERVRVYILVAKSRREEAVAGVERALSGLREAMGVAPDCPLVLAA